MTQAIGVEQDVTQPIRIVCCCCCVEQNHQSKHQICLTKRLRLDPYTCITTAVRSEKKCKENLNVNALFIVEVHLAIKLVYRHPTFNNVKETIQT